MAKARPTSVDDLPLALHRSDWAALIGRSVRTVKRMEKAGLLPQPLIEGAHDDGEIQPIWSKADIVTWLNGGSRRGRR